MAISTIHQDSAVGSSENPGRCEYLGNVGRGLGLGQISTRRRFCLSSAKILTANIFESGPMPTP
jgi:hypothetical protein